MILNRDVFLNEIMNGIEVSIVLPVYNEENIIENTVLEVEKILDSLKLSYEMILVDDG